MLLAAPISSAGCSTEMTLGGEQSESICTNRPEILAGQAFWAMRANQSFSTYNAIGIECRMAEKHLYEINTGEWMACKSICKHGSGLFYSNARMTPSAGVVVNGFPQNKKAQSDAFNPFQQMRTPRRALS
ncbi:MAG: hypothetical protein QM639_09165 [Rhodocyclaceae bacterium]